MSTSTGTTTGYTGSSFAQGGYSPEGSGGGLTDRCCDELARAVDQNPAGTLLTAFGAGLGIGVALALAVSFPQPKPKKRNVPEELGQRVLAALQDILPDAFGKRIG